MRRVFGAALLAGACYGAGSSGQALAQASNQNAGGGGLIQILFSGAAREPAVPRALQRAADWSWRLLLIGLLIYVAFRVASALALVVLPCIAALLLIVGGLLAAWRREGS